MRSLRIQDLYAQGGRRFWGNLAVSLYNPEGIAEALATLAPAVLEPRHGGRVLAIDELAGSV